MPAPGSTRNMYIYLIDIKCEKDTDNKDGYVYIYIYMYLTPCKYNCGKHCKAHVLNYLNFA